MLPGLLEDLRYAFRTLSRDRGFAAVALLTVALGVGVTTAMFSVVDHVLLRPLAYRDSGRLYSVHEIVAEVAKTYPVIPVNSKHFQTWREQVSAFESAGLFSTAGLNLTGAGAPEKLNALAVSSDLLSTLGVQPFIGRGFVTAEEKDGTDKVAILSYALWQSRFGGDRGVLGRKILLNGSPHEVVGVLPASFRFFKNKQIDGLVGLPPTVDLLKPIGFRADDEDMGEFNHMVIARLRPGVSAQAAEAELNATQEAIAARVAAANKDKATLRARLSPLQEQVVGPARTGLLVLLAAGAVVLLIVCVNVGNVMLARATVRSREAAIRTALGARPSRLIRQSLVESLLLAIGGGTLGIAVAYAGVRWLRANAPTDLPRIDEVTVDWRILLFAMAASTVSGVLFGIMPAWRATRARPVEALKSGIRGTTAAKHGTGLRSWLVGAEVAMSAVLLACAGLLLHSFVRVMDSERGFGVEHLLAARITLTGNQYGEGAKRGVFYDRLMRNLRALPGATATGMCLRLPLEGDQWVSLVTQPGDTRPMFQRPLSSYRMADPGYFQAMGIPLRQGRVFTESDRSHRVAVVSETFAKTIWPGENPIGKRFTSRDDFEKNAAEVVGVVADTSVDGLDKRPGLMGYFPYWDEPRDEASLVVRTSGDPRSVIGALRKAVADIDPDLPVSGIQTMDSVVTNSVSARRFQAFLASTFGAAALALAVIGIFGVVSYTVARRRSELGIRMALGAQTREIFALVLRQGMRPVWLGMLVGLLAALGVARAMASLLYGVPTWDPVTLLAVAGTLLAAALIACAAPAARASRTSPLDAIRYE